MKTSEQPKFMVCVKCITFNQSSYIEDALNGFTMQKTNFPYVCTILDDASTDGEQEVIKKYLQDNFDLENKSVVRNEETDDYVLTFAQHKTNRNCYFAVLFLKYNHYSIKKAKNPYIKEWLDVKYIALCEGDDYWISPEKLQKQFIVLRKDSSYTMVCCRTKRLSASKKTYLTDNACYDHDQNVKKEDIILRGGQFVSTCSIMFRADVQQNYPMYCINCHVGDYPLQIMCAMKGKVYYFNKAMSVYRVDVPGSWVTRQQEGIMTQSKIQGLLSEIRMLQGFSTDFPKYKNIFEERICIYLRMHMPFKETDPKGYKMYLKTFKKDLLVFKPRDLAHLIINRHNGWIGILYRHYKRVKDIFSKMKFFSR